MGKVIFYDNFPLPGDFEFFQFFAVLGNIFLYQGVCTSSPVLVIFYRTVRMSFYGFSRPVLENIILYQEKFTLYVLPLYHERSYPHWETFRFYGFSRIVLEHIFMYQENLSLYGFPSTGKLFTLTGDFEFLWFLLVLGNIFMYRETSGFCIIDYNWQEDVDL